MEFLDKALIWVEIIVGLGLLIFVHELGHFLMAKLHKVRVEAFSLGFPPNLFARKWGETEYRIGSVPLGGYVKMAGEVVGEGSGAPDELTSKSALARIQIFAAGALINLLVAFPIAIVACWAGRYVLFPQVGVPGLPEAAAGMKPGDTILRVDGAETESIERYRQQILGKSRGSEVKVDVRRRDGKEESLLVRQAGSSAHNVLPLMTKLGGIKKDGIAWTAGLRTDDVVVAVNGRPSLSAGEWLTALRDAPSKPVQVDVLRPSEENKRITVTLTAPPAAEVVWQFPADERLMEAVVGLVVDDTGAAGILQKGDVIRRIDGVDIRSWQGLRDAVEPKGGALVKVTFERAGLPQERELRVGFKGDGKGGLGIGPLDTKRFVDVAADSAFAGVIQPGDLLASFEVTEPTGRVPKVSLGGASGGDIGVGQLFKLRAFPESALMIKVERLPQPLRIPAQKKVIGDLAALGIDASIGPNDYFRTWSGMEGVSQGLREPVEMIGLTFNVLYKLVSGQESTKGLSGPVGIFQASYTSAQKSRGNFLWILILITVNLGVFNLLPIPVLDGGHVLLLLIEKFRGRPNSVRFVETFQISGLVLLLSLVVFVTWNDISRMIFHG